MDKNYRLIWSNDITPYCGDDAREEYLEFLELNGYTEDEMSIEEYASIMVESDLDAEIGNLDKPCGKILVIAQLGLWDGKEQAYKVINSNIVSDIFKSINSNYDVEFYCDRYNIRGKGVHHDGTNTYLFREIKSGVDITKLTDKIYEGEEIDSKTLCRYTKSLRPYVAKVYGW